LTYSENNKLKKNIKKNNLNNFLIILQFF